MLESKLIHVSERDPRRNVLNYPRGTCRTRILIK